MCTIPCYPSRALSLPKKNMSRLTDRVNMSLIMLTRPSKSSIGQYFVIVVVGIHLFEKQTENHKLFPLQTKMKEKSVGW